jgi:quercetin dioxygenase-like cupin family protein
MNDGASPARDPGSPEESSRLLLEHLGAAPQTVDCQLPTAALRERLMRRVVRSVDAAAAFHTVRGPAQWCDVAGLRMRWLYRRAGTTQLLRSGEPLRVRELCLAAGEQHRLPVDDAAVRCEWLVLQGDVCIDGLALNAFDYHTAASGPHVFTLRSALGGRLLLREAAAGPATPSAATTARAAEASWLRVSEHIERRVLAQWGHEAALLYRVEPGADVPHHGHGHDEECLLLAGELFLDDVLLREGEYQLAPAGTHHEDVSSDTGALVYGHGDIELALSGR